jgi:alpha-beta hydrolase superfamily lysophospholipase
MTRSALTLAFTLTLSGCSGGSSTPDDLGSPGDLTSIAGCPTEVTFPSADGLIVHGTFTPPCGRATVVLAHQLCSDRSEWSDPSHDWVSAFGTRGIATLAIDLRGHGESTLWPDGSTKDLCAGGANALYAGMVDDVKAAIAYARGPLGAPKVAAIGASIGSNSAINAYAADAATTMVVALSPGLDYRGITTETPVKAFGARPALLEAADDDPAAAMSVRTLAMDNPAVMTMVWPSGGHANAILAAHPDELPRVADLVAATLK